MLAGLALGQPESRRPREAPVPRELPISRAQAQAYRKVTVAEVCASAPTIVCRNELGVTPPFPPFKHISQGVPRRRPLGQQRDLAVRPRAQDRRFVI